jgi:hypothetical protein
LVVCYNDQFFRLRKIFHFHLRTTTLFFRRRSDSTRVSRAPVDSS